MKIKTATTRFARNLKVLNKIMINNEQFIFCLLKSLKNYNFFGFSKK